MKVWKILCINPGSTSTKIGFFNNSASIYVETIRHSDKDLGAFKQISEQTNFRLKLIERIVKQWKIAALDAVVGRGGLLPPLESGTYRVNGAMLKMLEKAARGEHASNLGAPLALSIAQKFAAEPFIIDPVSVDEILPQMRLSGHPAIERQSLSHALNIRAVAHRFAKGKKKELKELNLIVAHLGSGCSLAAIKNGKMVDVINPRDEGPFSPERSGGLPILKTLQYFIEENPKRYTEIERELFNSCGLYAYLGTRDMKSVEKMRAEGDAKAKLVLSAMELQIAKAIGELAVSLHGKVTAIIITGGLAFDKRLIRNIKQYVKFIAPVFIFGGEDELKAMAEGAVRVLSGKEKIKNFEVARW